MANDGNGLPPIGPEPEPKPIVDEASFALVPLPAIAKGPPAMTPVRTHKAAIDPMALLQALQRRWVLALTLGLLCAGAAGVAARYLLPPSKLTARTRMRVPTTQGGGRHEMFAGLSDQKTHLAMLKSRLVLQSAVDVPEVKKLKIVWSKTDPVTWLEKEIQADFGNAPEVMTISMNGDNAAHTTLIVEEVRKAYCREVLDRERIEGKNRLKLLNELKAGYEAKLQKAKDEQRELLKKSGADTGSRAMVQAWYQQNLAWRERDMMQTQSELRRCRAELAVAEEVEKTNAAAPVPATLVDDLIASNVEYQQAQAKLKSVQKEIEDFKRRSVRGEADPAFAPLATQHKAVQAALQQLQNELKPIYTDAVKKKRTQDASTSISSLKIRISVYETDEKILQAGVDEWRQKLVDLQDNVVKLDQVREDISVPQKLVTRLEEDIAKLDLALQLPVTWSVLEEGVVTQVSDRKRILMAAGAASGGAFLFVCLAIALWEFRLQRISSADQVVYGLGVKLVGAIPDSAPTYPRRKGSVDEEAMQGLFSDAFDATRTMLLRTAKTHSLQAIMISSAESGEGKTTLSVHLAASLAQVGHRTLLIDADLRNPVAHLVFGLDPSPGLCDLLRLQTTLDSVLRPTSIENLTMLTAGIWDSRATRALAQDGTGELLRELRGKFDFILIDTSPVLPVVDPMLIGQHVDGAILSVMRGKSCMPNVYAAHQRLTGAGIRVLGTVVSGVKAQRYGAAYYPTKSNQPAEKKT